MKTKNLISVLDELLMTNESKKHECVNLINQMNRKTQLVNFIKTFIGVDGFVPFEHGYKPNLLAIPFKNSDICWSDIYGVSQTNILMKKNKKIDIAQLDKTQLMAICQTLYDYSFFCRYRA